MRPKVIIFNFDHSNLFRERRIAYFKKLPTLFEKDLRILEPNLLRTDFKKKIDLDSDLYGTSRWSYIQPIALFSAFKAADFTRKKTIKVFIFGNNTITQGDRKKTLGIQPRCEFKGVGRWWTYALVFPLPVPSSGVRPTHHPDKPLLVPFFLNSI